MKVKINAVFHHLLKAPMFNPRWKDPEGRSFLWWEGKIAVWPAVKWTALYCPNSN